MPIQIGEAIKTRSTTSQASRPDAPSSNGMMMTWFSKPTESIMIMYDCKTEIFGINSPYPVKY